MSLCAALNVAFLKTTKARLLIFNISSFKCFCIEGVEVLSDCVSLRQNLYTRTTLLTVRHNPEMHVFPAERAAVSTWNTLKKRMTADIKQNNRSKASADVGLQSPLCLSGISSTIIRLIDIDVTRTRRALCGLHATRRRLLCKREH